MRRIRLLIMSVSMLMFTGLFLSSLNAQISFQEFSNNNSGNSRVTAMTEVGGALGDTDIDPGDITATVDKATVYAEASLEAISNGDKGYTGMQKDLAIAYYSEFLMNLSNEQGQKSSEVAHALVRTYNVIASKIGEIPNGSSHISFLESLAESTVNELQ